jgi:hypothetical protein
MRQTRLDQAQWPATTNPLAIRAIRKSRWLLFILRLRFAPASLLICTSRAPSERHARGHLPNHPRDYVRDHPRFSRRDHARTSADTLCGSPTRRLRYRPPSCPQCIRDAVANAPHDAICDDIAGMSVNILANIPRDAPCMFAVRSRACSPYDPEHVRRTILSMFAVRSHARSPYDPMHGHLHAPMHGRCTIPCMTAA